MSNARRTIPPFSTLLLAAALGLGGNALAAAPWIGVPSATTAQMLVVAGGDLAPWQAVVLKVTLPSGQQATQAASANASGRLAAEIPTAATGAYLVDVFDAAGQRLGGGRFVVTR